MKTCNACRVEKANNEFYNDKSKKDGLSSRCKLCVKESANREDRVVRRAEYRREYYRNNTHIFEERRRRNKESGKALERNRTYKLREHFGITPEQYNELLKSQGGVCKICGGVTGYKHLSVDHNHADGVVRGLLCDICNRAIGSVREDTEMLRRMIAYLERYNSVENTTTSGKHAA